MNTPGDDEEPNGAVAADASGRNARAPRARVIAISGPSGAGKTTLVAKVAIGLRDATTLYYDADAPGDPLACVRDYLAFRLGDVYRRQQQVGERADLVIDGL